ncbi:methyltransferase domain-containing protein [Kitasatospora sp. NPDC028055]|uniref:methyltransferase domain-containing protein n=1 Tax=Kitasatospora sp. NPDC028055 TaxID=3155653 RepID=UPI00340875E5
MVRLIDDSALTASSVVANSTMNRGRGLRGVNSYTRELGFDPAAWLREHGGAAPGWLDLCSGEGRALVEAAAALPAGAELTGVDLLGPLVPPPVPPAVPPAGARLRLVTAALADWAPERSYQLITCVHGLHYLGDQLGAITRAASWLSPDGRFAAHFDPESVRRPDGSGAGRAVLAALRAAGVEYRPRRHLLLLDGGRPVALPFEYAGADPSAGPNWTGQPAVGSYYRRAVVPRGRAES